MSSNVIKTIVRLRRYSGGRTPIYREVRTSLCHILGTPMPPKRNIGKSSHKQCPVELNAETLSRKSSHKARKHANKTKPFSSLWCMKVRCHLSFFGESWHKRSRYGSLTNAGLIVVLFACWKFQPKPVHFLSSGTAASTISTDAWPGIIKKFACAIVVFIFHPYPATGGYLEFAVVRLVIMARSAFVQKTIQRSLSFTH